MVSQNDSIAIDFSRVHLARRRRSRSSGARCISRAADQHPRPVRARAARQEPVGLRHDKRSIARSATRTRSMLTVPMINQRDEVIGVIQLINKRARGRAASCERRATSTTGSCRSTSAPRSCRSTLASQAGISLENTLLYEDIRRLFEGFVNAVGHRDRIARSDDVGSLAARRRRSPSGWPRRSTASRAGPIAGVHFTRRRPEGDRVRRRCCTTSARSACASRCWSRPRSCTSTSASCCCSASTHPQVRSRPRRSQAQARPDGAARGWPRPSAASASSTSELTQRLAELDELHRVHPQGERADGAGRGQLRAARGDRAA